MSTAVDQARADVEQADADLAAAQAELETLEQSIAWGNGGVSAADLSEKESLVNFAKRRLDGVRTALRRAQNAGAINDAKADLDRIAAADLADTSELLKSWKAAVLAIRSLVDIAERRDSDIDEHIATMTGHDQTLTSVNAGMSAAALGFVEGFRPRRDDLGQIDRGYAIDRGGAYMPVCKVSADRLIALVIECAVPGDLTSHISAASASDQTILRSLLERMPGLAAAADEIQHPDVPPALWRRQRVEAEGE